MKESCWKLNGKEKRHIQMIERYSIEVTDEIVEIYGDLTIEEAFDFLSFFERKGYKSVVLGSENSTLRMVKRDQAVEIVDQRISDLKEQLDDYKEYYKKEQLSHEITKNRVIEVEVLMKQLMSEEYKKYKALYEENQKIIRAQMLSQLEDNPEVQEIMSRAISRPMTQEEKDGAFNQLLNLKKDYPDILPSVEQLNC